MCSFLGDMPAQASSSSCMTLARTLRQRRGQNSSYNHDSFPQEHEVLQFLDVLCQVQRTRVPVAEHLVLAQLRVSKRTPEFLGQWRGHVGQHRTERPVGRVLRVSGLVVGRSRRITIAQEVVVLVDELEETISIVASRLSQCICKVIIPRKAQLQGHQATTCYLIVIMN